MTLAFRPGIDSPAFSLRLTLAAALALLAARCQAATVVGNLADISLEPLNTRLVFVPTNEVLLSTAGLSAGPARVVEVTNGSFAVVLDAGDYVVSLPLVPLRRPFGIAVMPTNGTVNITNLLSLPRTYTYTNPCAAIAVENGFGSNTVLLQPFADRLTLGRPGTFITTNQYGVVLVDAQAPWPRFGFSTNPAAPDISGGPFIGWEPGHPNGGEIHLTSPGALSLNLNYAAAQPNSGLQVGSSGPFHDRIWIQYDDDPGNGHGNLGRSKVLEFASRFLGANGTVQYAGAGAFPWRFGLRQEMLATNGDLNLVLYSAVPVITGTAAPGNYYGTNAQEQAGFALARFGTNRVTIDGQLVAGTVTPMAQVLGPADLAIDGNVRSMAGLEAPLYPPDTIALKNTGGGRTTTMVPNWVTQAVSTVLVQWSGDTPLHWTNRCQSFWYLDPEGRQVAQSVDLPILLTNHLNQWVFTNTWPRTNRLKAASLFQPQGQTNTSRSVHLLRWQMTLAGQPD